eukprot:5724456-Amphidinium_carterae.1
MTGVGKQMIPSNWCSNMCPEQVLGVLVDSLSVPSLLAVVQQKKHGDGNCFWRSCATSECHWKRLPRVKLRKDFRTCMFTSRPLAPHVRTTLRRASVQRC